VVLYDFDGEGDDELSVNEGDRVIVLDNADDDWWKVRKGGEEGVLPATYVEVSLHPIGSPVSPG
jgi:actin cytoskeleton-regulatory complex protein SLA1